MPLPWSNWLPIASAFGLCVALTPVVRWLARHWGAVAQPRPDRWHQKPTALLGGIAIFLSVVSSQLVFGPTMSGHAGWMAGCAIMFIMGLIDDLRGVRPLHKLFGQLAAAGAVLLDGQTVAWTGMTGLDIAITVFWFVGITNALNLIDNMDGLAGGVGAIASGFFAVHFFTCGEPADAVRFATLAAALVGFLIYNFNPASIFMGDSGSQFVGFYLAGAALVTRTPADTSSLTAIALPVMILAVPIYDTCFVTLTRICGGRPVSQGGRDHTSHRLVAAGLSERAAVVFLCAISASAGLLAIGVMRLTPILAAAVVSAFACVALVFGSWLGRNTGYAEHERKAK